MVSVLVLCGLAAHNANAAPPTRAEAFRFLNQATFGPTGAEIDRLIALGDSSQAYAQWIDEQMAIGPSLELPAVQAKYAVSKSPWVLQDARQDIWFKHAVRAPDQLRQRVAFALSEIMVVSQHSELLFMPFATADYYDLLSRGAFGDFRQLMEDVTLHPAMGTFLNMLGNRKPDPLRNIRPDENYARELMQLFSIGLVKLNPDGSVPVNAAGDPFPTYDQSVIEGFAHVFTGWNYSGATLFSKARRTHTTQVQPMKAYPEEHATGSKKLLSYPGVAQPVLPEGQTAQQDLEARSIIFSITRMLDRSSRDSSSNASSRVTRRGLTWRASQPCSTTTGRGIAATSAPSSRRSCSIRRPGRVRRRRPTSPASSRSRCCDWCSSGGPTTRPLAMEITTSRTRA